MTLIPTKWKTSQNFFTPSVTHENHKKLWVYTISEEFLTEQEFRKYTYYLQGTRSQICAFELFFGYCIC